MESKGWQNKIIKYDTKPADQFQANPLNFRTHPQRQRKAMRASLDDNGWVAPVIENQRTGHLLDGHERVWQALKNENAEVPFILIDVSEEDEGKIIASLDPIAALAEVDKDKLDEVLHGIQTDNADLMAFLSDLAEDNGLYFGEQEELEDPGAEIDKAEELREKWGVESGQLWQLGEHRVICGDCTDKAVVDRLEVDANIMVTDPPYGVEYDADWRNKLFGEGDRAIGKVSNDDEVDWRKAWKLFSGDVSYCWHADRHASKVEESLVSVGLLTRSQIIWNKSHFVVGRGHYSTRHEPCWYSVRKGKNASWCGDNNEQTIWTFGVDERAQGGHSTQKPIECMERPIRNHRGDVYDPFLGSGTTLIACERLNRKCYGVEIEPKYVAVTLERWHQMTGEMPVLVAKS